MPLSGKQSRCRIEPNPARSRKKDFSPGVEIREIGAGPSRTFERLNVCRKLNQIARNETRRQAKAAQDLDQ
jgi:hypothetical protein